MMELPKRHAATSLLGSRLSTMLTSKAILPRVCGLP